jgi:hypothetical protein
VLGHELVQLAQAGDPLRQPGPGQAALGLVDDLDVVVVLGPVVTHEQHVSCPPRSPMINMVFGSVEETTAA